MNVKMTFVSTRWLPAWCVHRRAVMVSIKSKSYNVKKTLPTSFNRFWLLTDNAACGVKGGTLVECANMSTTNMSTLS